MSFTASEGDAASVTSVADKFAALAYDLDVALADLFVYALVTGFAANVAFALCASVRKHDALGQIARIVSAHKWQRPFGIGSVV